MMKKTILPLQLLVAPDKNDPAPLILYHGRNCPDGFGAALAAWLSFSVDTELLRRPFGVYLLAAGIYTLLQKPAKP